VNSIAILEARQLWPEKEAKPELAVRVASRERNIQHLLDIVRIQSQADAEVMSRHIFFLQSKCKLILDLCFLDIYPSPLILSFASQMSYHVYDKQKHSKGGNDSCET
jgi:hypothetical protein